MFHGSVIKFKRSDKTKIKNRWINAVASRELVIVLFLLANGIAASLLISSGENNEHSQTEENQTHNLEPIHYDFTLNKPTKKEELREVIISELQARPQAISIQYYGEDVRSGEDVINLINEIQFSSNYYGNNLLKYTIDTKKDLNKTEDDAYEVSLYNLKYRTSNQEENYVSKKVLEITNKNILSEMDEYERVRFVYDYILDNKEYTYNTYNNGQSAYSFFKNGKGVCHAYALSAARLLDEAGIENHFVFGDTTQNGFTEPHTWNKVKIDDEWYNIDTTWADKDNGRDEYFLISDKTLGKTHTERTKEHMPKATNKKYE